MQDKQHRISQHPVGKHSQTPQVDIVTNTPITFSTSLFLKMTFRFLNVFFCSLVLFATWDAFVLFEEMRTFIFFFSFPNLPHCCHILFYGSSEGGRVVLSPAETRNPKNQAHVTARSCGPGCPETFLRPEQGDNPPRMPHARTHAKHAPKNTHPHTQTLCLHKVYFSTAFRGIVDYKGYLFRQDQHAQANIQQTHIYINYTHK